MDRNLRKRIMRNIINNADQMVVIFGNGETRLLSSLPLRAVFRIMTGMLHAESVHAVVGRRMRKPYSAPSVESTPQPVIYAPGVH